MKRPRCCMLVTFCFLAATCGGPGMGAEQRACLGERPQGSRRPAPRAGGRGAGPHGAGLGQGAGRGRQDQPSGRRRNGRPGPLSRSRRNRGQGRGDHRGRSGAGRNRDGMGAKPASSRACPAKLLDAWGGRDVADRPGQRRMCRGLLPEARGPPRDHAWRPGASLERAVYAEECVGRPPPDRNGWQAA